MRFHVITMFPSSFDSYLNESILKRAIENKKIKVSFYNPKDFKPRKKVLSYAERRVDDKPYGGGPGMVIEALPVAKAISKALAVINRTAAKKTKGKKSKPAPKTKILFFSPGGKMFTHNYVQAVAPKYTDLILVCGRYEGIDARIKKIFKMEDISIGDFVLTGGELPAMIVIDTMARQVPGVLGNFNSREETRAASDDVYTRPEVFEYNKKKYRVPKVLLSGNHKLIEEWRAGNRKLNNGSVQ